MPQFLIQCNVEFKVQPHTPILHRLVHAKQASTSQFLKHRVGGVDTLLFPLVNIWVDILINDPFCCLLHGHLLLSKIL